MKKVQIVSPEEAALRVNDGDTIATGGFVSCACPSLWRNVSWKPVIRRI